VTAPRNSSFVALLRSSLLVCGVALVVAALAWLLARWLGLWSQR
jgi:hypothetical protein